MEPTPSVHSWALWQRLVGVYSADGMFLGGLLLLWGLAALLAQLWFGFPTTCICQTGAIGP